jgi:hypothetical protein
MFGFGPATRIYVATGATDMRKGFNGLYGRLDFPLCLCGLQSGAYAQSGSGPLNMPEVRSWCGMSGDCPRAHRLEKLATFEQSQRF